MSRGPPGDGHAGTHAPGQDPLSGVVEPDAPLPLVLVHDGARVAVGKPVLVGQPVGAFLTSEERWSRFQALEPLNQVASGYGRDARDQILMRLQGVVQCPGTSRAGRLLAVEPAPRGRP